MANRDRDEKQVYEDAVIYEVWRRGGNPDRIDHDRLSDGYYQGVPEDDMASRELRRQRPHLEPTENKEPEEEDRDR